MKYEAKNCLKVLYWRFSPERGKEGKERASVRKSEGVGGGGGGEERMKHDA